MKRIFFLCLLFGILTCRMPALAQSGEVRSPDSTAAWREDLAYMVDQVAKRHPDPYRYTSQAAFEAMASDLDARIPELTDAQIIVGMMRYTASLSDGHTSFFPAFQTRFPFRAYPLLFYLFDDGVFLVDAAPEYADMIGAQLVGIGGRDAADVVQQIDELVQHDNDSGRRVLIPINIVATEVLLGAGIIEDADQPQFLLERLDGTSITLDPAPISMSQFIARFPDHWRMPSSSAMISRAHLHDKLWWMPLDDEHTLYAEYNQVQTLGGMLTDFRHDLDAPGIDRLILDLRFNGGGDIGTARTFFNLLSNDARFQQSGSLIVLIGRNTFSAAVVFSLWLERDLHPVFVGEPSGGRPLMFENARPFTLPNSHLEVYLSSRARRDVDASDTRTAIEPDVPVPLLSADYFADRDAALEAALSL